MQLPLSPSPRSLSHACADSLNINSGRSLARRRIRPLRPLQRSDWLMGKLRSAIGPFSWADKRRRCIGWKDAISNYALPLLWDRSG